MVLAACLVGPGVGAAPVCPASALPGLGARAAALRAVVGPSALDSTALADATLADERLVQIARAAAAWQEFAFVLASVSGRSDLDAAALRAVARALVSGSAVPLACDRNVTARDQLAWQMSLGGYSARETTDVLEGRLTRRDLDRAQALRLAGYGDEAAAAFLDRAIAARRYARRTSTARTRPRLAPAAPGRYEAEIDRLSRAHGLDPALVHAVIAAESNGDPRAESHAGAIGLMQLMPATAAFLGVDPHDPLDNLRGGIAYLAGLVRTYGNARDALIAYNAGPGHADRVRRGLASLYDETLRYLRAIDGRYRILRP